MARRYRSAAGNRRSSYKKHSYSGNNNNKIKYIAIIAGAVALLAAVIFLLIPALTQRPEDIVGIAVRESGLPTKTTYFVGEEANWDGLRVTVTRRNGETFEVRANKCRITGFSSEAPVEKRVITVTYEGHSTTFSVAVKAAPKADPVLTGIRLDPKPKTQYKVGERLDTSGGYVVREYADGSTVKVNLLPTDIEEDFNAIRNTPGTYTLTVKYRENGVIKTCTYQVTISK